MVDPGATAHEARPRTPYERARPAREDARTGTLGRVTTRALPSALRRARRTGLIGIVAGAFLLGGCATMSPVQTNEPALSADGIDANLSTNVLLRSLLIVAAEKDGPGRISGQVVNNETSSVELTFTTDGGSSAKVSVPANSSTNLADKSLTVANVTVPPGAMAAITVSAAGAGDALLEVPVLPPTLYYSSLTPAPSS